MLWRLLGRFRETITLVTKQGLLCFSTKDQGIGRLLFINREYEYCSSLEAIRFLKDSGFIPANNVSMLDIGANIGLISTGLLLSGAVDRVVAIEPEPRNYRLLKKNVAQNSLESKMACLNLAVGDHAGRGRVAAVALRSDRTQPTPGPGQLDLRRGRHRGHARSPVACRVRVGPDAWGCRPAADGGPPG